MLELTREGVPRRQPDRIKRFPRSQKVAPVQLMSEVPNWGFCGLYHLDFISHVPSGRSTRVGRRKFARNQRSNFEYGTNDIECTPRPKSKAKPSVRAKKRFTAHAAKKRAAKTWRPLTQQRVIAQRQPSMANSRRRLLELSRRPQPPPRQPMRLYTSCATTRRLRVGRSEQACHLDRIAGVATFHSRLPRMFAPLVTPERRGCC